MNKLFEGLREGDLEDLVIGEITIDEYESKIDNEQSIVVGFYVDDKEPADDLRSFIEKSSTDLLDAEVSPAPDEDGYYIVFAEFPRKKQFPHDLVEVVKSMEMITGISEWTFTVYKKKGTFELTEENVKKYVNLNPKKVKSQEKEDGYTPEDEAEDEDDGDELANFLNESILDKIIIRKNVLILEKYGVERRFGIISFGDLDDVIAKHQLYEEEYSLTFEGKKKRKEIVEMFGSNWDSSWNNGNLLISRDNSNKVLYLREL